MLKFLEPTHSIINLNSHGSVLKAISVFYYTSKIVKCQKDVRITKNCNRKGLFNLILVMYVDVDKTIYALLESIVCLSWYYVSEILCVPVHNYCCSTNIKEPC